MLSTNPPVAISEPFAVNGTKNVIPNASQIGITNGAASFNDGFPPLTFLPLTAGGVPPFGADFNGILNMITQTVLWVQSGGKFGYNAAFQTAVGGYPKGAVLLRGDLSGFWFNAVDGNETNPDAGGAGWIPWGGSSQILPLAVSSSSVVLTALQAASPIIVITGLLTSNITLTFPAWSGIQWTVINSTTGNFAISAGISGGSSSIVLQGGSNQIYSNGSGMASIFPQSNFVAPQSSRNTYFPALNTSYTQSLTFVAPCNGWVMGTATLNISLLGSPALNFQNAIFINGVNLQQDNTDLPMSNTGVAAVTAGETVTVKSVVTAGSTGQLIQIAQIVSYIFIPNP
jgi:hypothetical protein